MQTNATPTLDLHRNTTGCCPMFDPEGWSHETLHFEDKLFVRATAKSAMYMPLNMGKVFGRVQEHMEDVGAIDPTRALVLSRDLSPWQSEHFFAADKDVPGEDMVRISGDFITRVFEGPYSKAASWINEMKATVEATGKDAGRIFLYYTTCPKCAKAYGQNFVVGVAESI